MAFKPIWYVLITPVGGTAQDVSFYVSDMTASGGGGLGSSGSPPSGGAVAIDIQDSTTDQASTFSLNLWDHENTGLLTQFGIGDEVQVWTDTRESQSDITETATVTTAGISVPVKAWLSLSDTSLQTSTSVDGKMWGPFAPVNPDGTIQSPPYRWIKVNSGSATVTYKAMPKRLTGLVTQYDTGQSGPNFKAIALSGQDYTSKTMNVLVTGAYLNQTYDYIIKDILSIYFPDITTNHVETGAGTVDYISFQSKAAFDAFGQLANMAGWDWYVDENKDFHWFSAAENPNPIVLTNTGANANVLEGSVKVTVDGTQMQNKITFYGGSYESSARTESRLGDGQTTTWQLTYPIAKYVSYANASQLTPQTPTVSVNGVAKTVGQDGIDTGMDFYISTGQNYITQAQGATPLASGDVLTVTYTYWIPLIIQQQVDASIAQFGVFEGAMTDSSQTNTATAVAMVQGQLQQHAWPIVYAACDSWEPTFASGQNVQFNLPDHGLNDQWMRVTQVHHQMSSEDYIVTVTGYGQQA
ncbi:hypothetical protein [Alicyclobacillus ferrooxydans]|uniref:Uncharacterized protein n=1 Tax=Alicyclobacillus ferrooxydans TaxID=471514 RepID=A0A0P9EHD2_9BACL|nr:hypothetical protein [Alicyclobacillus ferrooxydans]KPV42025.1 hypothetical protein AN477_19850 [Alicyclobacillus ferrooxydans]